MTIETAEVAGEIIDTPLPDIGEFVGIQCCLNCWLAREVPGTGGRRWRRVTSWDRRWGKSCRSRARIDNEGGRRTYVGDGTRFSAVLTVPRLCGRFVSMDDSSSDSRHP